MKIVFVGDIFCGGDLLREKPSSHLIQLPEFYEADFRVGNLEGPLSDSPLVADKCLIYSPTSAVKYLTAFRIDGVSLANNHIQDKTAVGIMQTINTLNMASIRHCGAGGNMHTARQPMLLHHGDQTAAILGYCDFNRYYMKKICVAEENSPGVAPLRYEIIIEDLEDLPHDVNRVILLFHWGREHTWFPPNHDIQLARKLLDHPKVDLIIGCHSHLPQGCIMHNEKKAFMGLGNFLAPNSFIKPRVQIDYPDAASDYTITHGYHAVNKLTHKRWTKWCRRAVVVSYDTINSTSHINFTEQDYLNPVVSGTAIPRRFYAISWIYNKKGPFYASISDSWYLYVLLKTYLYNACMMIRQFGLIKFMRIIFGKVFTNRIRFNNSS